MKKENNFFLLTESTLYERKMNPHNSDFDRNVFHSYFKIVSLQVKINNCCLGEADKPIAELIVYKHYPQFQALVQAFFFPSILEQSWWEVGAA